jgi:hypothetical protein
MQMANMASANSARASHAGNDQLAQSIGMSFSLEIHNATMTEDFLTDGSFAAVDMITAAVPTGWAGSRVAGWVGKTAAGTAVNAVGTKIFRIAGYVTDPIKGAIARIGKYVTDAVKAATTTIAQLFNTTTTRGGRQYVNLASDARTTHILYGDGPASGGHLWPGQAGKTPFPQSWSGEKIMHEISDIATDPNVPFSRADGLSGLYYKSGKPARFVGHGVRDGVRIRVVCEPAGEGIITGFPSP